MELSVVVPTINSATHIAAAVNHMDSYLRSNSRIKRYEIIIAAQTSSDTTFAVIKNLRKKHILPLYIRPVGKGIGLHHGIKKAQYPWILMIDDDLSYPIEFLGDALKEAKNNDILIGSRYMRKQQLPLVRQIASSCYRGMVSLLFSIHQHDIQSGLKLFRKELFSKIRVRETGYVWDTELLYRANKAGMRIKEIPITYHFVRNKLKLSSAVPKMFFSMLRLRLVTLL